MEREKKVVDASVITKWFVNEAETKKALELRNKHVSGSYLIIIPELLFLEVLNALRYKGNNDKMLQKVNEALWEMQLHIERTSHFLLKTAIKISLKNSLSLYDSIYAALSQLHGCQLITSDKKLGKLPNAKLL